MSIVQFYGVLATTASVFVGILTAYLVTRLSDLKSERSRLRQRIEAIDAELRVLQFRHEFRIEQLEETEDRWKREEAENVVDDFIKYTVGSDWNPSHNDVTVEDAMDALIHYQDISQDELIQHHVEVLKDRWDEIIDELEPRQVLPGTQMSNVPLPQDESITAGNYIVKALWDIYDREKYDTHNSKVLNIRREVDELRDRREVLVEQHDSLDPKQLRDSITSTIFPIGLSVVLPLLIRFLHELGWVIRGPSYFVVLEAMGVLTAWLVGFLWTLRFVWVRISDTEEELPEPPLPEGRLSGNPEPDDTAEAATADTDSESEETEGT